MVNVRYCIMTLLEKHRTMFLEESSRLTRLVLDCLQKLGENPNDCDCIEKMVNIADLIRCNAKFLQDKDLELGAKMIRDFFKGVQDIRERQKEFDLVKRHFRKLCDKTLKTVLDVTNICDESSI